MTPAEHYAQAERWQQAALAVDETEWVMVDGRAYSHDSCLRHAQFHATLALVDSEVRYR